jgi:hypothetical protein
VDADGKGFQKGNIANSFGLKLFNTKWAQLSHVVERVRGILFRISLRIIICYAEFLCAVCVSAIALGCNTNHSLKSE